ncbi:DUF4181 domain-containing protein [Evansella cellulosilytica]|uniref:Uncharacterized protein n=1 Tax=Evansella cellulosilytica (strain ATCC 21833 / DSM 2522 / FERM P-1141 / JCM 9156 / N-4) TaxID=649639 RepID=E6TWP7_EVAC2|nr:DUF4181 domain-containing protein [Evansella cellulosilytica]ADU28730.1 hypothetical protein Bcell_0448 [Evansella cellulosilytica DSM 2522]
MFYTLLSLLAIFITIFEKIAEKKLVKGEIKKLSETSGNYLSKIGELVIAITALLILFLVMDQTNYNDMMWFWVSFAIVLFTFRATLERIYLEGKKYVATVAIMIFFVIGIINISFITSNMMYTTFTEEVLEKLNATEIDKVEFIRGADRAQVTFHAEDEIQNVLHLFESVNLKRDRNIYIHYDEKYTLRIYGGYKQDDLDNLREAVFKIEFDDQAMWIHEAPLGTRRNASHYYEAIHDDNNLLEKLKIDEFDWILE